MIQPTTSSASQTPVAAPGRPARRMATVAEFGYGALKFGIAALAIFAPGAAAAGRTGPLHALTAPNANRRLLDVNVNCAEGDTFTARSGNSANYNAACGGRSAASIGRDLINGGQNQNING